MGPLRGGKSSFLTSIPDLFIIDAERKTNWARDTAWAPGTTAWYPEGSPNKTGWDRTKIMVDHLCGLAKLGKCPYKMIGIDTMDELFYKIVIPDLSLPYLKQGKLREGQDLRDYKSSEKGSGGWNLLTSEVLALLWKISASGLGWCVIGHEKEDKTTVERDGKTIDIIDQKVAMAPSLLSGIWRASEFFTRIERRPEMVTKTDAAGRIVGRSTVMRCFLVNSPKKADSSVVYGNNLGIDAEIPIDLGQGWSAFTKAVEATWKPTEKPLP